MWFKVVCFCSCSQITRCSGWMLFAQFGYGALCDADLFAGFLCFRHFVLASNENQQQSHTHTKTESKSQRSISTIQIHFSLRQTSLMLWFVCGMVDFNTESFVSLFVCCYCAFFSSWSQIIGIYFQANKKSLMQCSIISHTHTQNTFELRSFFPRQNKHDTCDRVIGMVLG